MSHDQDRIQELQRALAHLDDPPYLENLSLAKGISSLAQSPDLSRGQALRRALRLAIAALDPGTETASSGLDARSYQVLYGYAISRKSIMAIALAQNISKRQAYRELRRATEALARIMDDLLAGSDIQDQALPVKAPTRAAQLRAELERLASGGDQDVGLTRLVGDVVESVQHLAHEKGIDIQFRAETSDLHVEANRVMLRQALLNLLSHAVSHHRGSGLMVSLCRSGPNASVQIRYSPHAASGHLHPQNPYRVATKLLDSLGIALTRSETKDMAEFLISIPLAQEHTLLIIDDNEGLIGLFRRYLQGRHYRVYGATTADEGLDMLRVMQPEVVILDVMMPVRDGWEALQAIRAQEAGRKVRVIVCSIINDPQLAQALGADAFLNKPVDRSSLLQALETVLSAPS